MLSLRRFSLYHSARFFANASAAPKPKKAKSADENQDAHKFSETVILPKTEFSMRAEAAVREPALQSICCDGVYSWQRDTRLSTPGHPQFVLHDGPPFANGPLHVGHFLNKVLKDIINRYKLLQGFGVPFYPGWDCHGLPIELKALELISAAKRTSLSPVELRAVAQKLAEAAIAVQKHTFKRWGVMGDWEHPYRTMDPQYEALQLGVFGELVEKGLIYRALKPVHWSPSSRTALAEAELEYKDDHVSQSVYVAFPLRALSDKLRHAAGVTLERFPNLRALIWTTTPWTLPANAGICLHPELEYSIVSLPTAQLPETARSDQIPQADRAFFVVASALVEVVTKVMGLTSGSLTVEVGGLAGALFAGSEAAHPTMNARASPLLCGIHVTAGSGTGLVHTAPGHGQEDWVAGRAVGLPVYVPVTPDGKFTADAGPELEGKQVLAEGNLAVIEQLKRCGALMQHSPFKHRYPIDWRTKKPIIQRAAEQWFCQLDGLQEDALKALSGVQLVPSQGQSQLAAVVAARAEWCISRQRHWGLPIPVFYDEQSGEPLLTRESVAQVASIFAQHGSGAWWTMSTEELLPPSHRNNGRRYVRGMDTMDVWFDSGVAWRAALQPRGIHVNPSSTSSSSPAAPASSSTSTVSSIQVPAVDVVLEGEDQYRGWFQSLLLTSVAATGQAPYKTVITHGFVLDEEGRKMSKSLGNVFDPNLTITGFPSEIPTLADLSTESKPAKPAKGAAPTAYGADLLRLWVASTDYTSAVSIGLGVISKVLDARNKLRNTFRFLLGILHDFSAAKVVPTSELLPVDRYLLHDLHRLQNEIFSGYESYNFIKVYRAVTIFTNVQISAFYSSIVKNRLYCDATDSLARRSAQTVLFEVLQTLTRALAPVLCHTAEEVYQHISPSLRPFFRQHNSTLVPASQSANVNKSEFDSLFCHGWFYSDSQWALPGDSQGSWKSLMVARDVVNRAIESARSKKIVGSSLEVILVIESASPQLSEILNELQKSASQQPGVSHYDALEELFIVSSVSVQTSSALSVAADSASDAEVLVTDGVVPLPDGTPTNVRVHVRKSRQGKCCRCWAMKPLNPEGVCTRCASVLAQM